MHGVSARGEERHQHMPRFMKGCPAPGICHPNQGPARSHNKSHAAPDAVSSALADYGKLHIDSVAASMGKPNWATSSGKRTAATANLWSNIDKPQGIAHAQHSCMSPDSDRASQ